MRQQNAHTENTQLLVLTPDGGGPGYLGAGPLGLPGQVWELKFLPYEAGVLLAIRKHRNI